LVVKERTDLVEHKLRFAHDHAPTLNLLEAIESVKPHAIIGVSGMPQSFTQPCVEAMGRINARPIIFALSNPTSKSECTAEQAYTWTNGRAIYASGSPFPPFELNGHTHISGQGNNSYIFPGVGLGVIASKSSRVTNEMFSVAAKVLASLATNEDLAVGRIFPNLTRIREVSTKIAVAVADIAFNRGLARQPRPADLLAHINAQMYQPDYADYV
jgi:malate dehydrogenase (oxaloacetate-decarboxylating)(NADP+)